MEKKPKSSRLRLKDAAFWPPSLPAACPFCGETTDVAIDLSGGRNQSYVEDCVECCRPSLVHLHTDEMGDPSLWLERGDG
jgi:hypothetical protein